MSAIHLAGYEKGRFGAVLACLLAIFLSSAPARPQLTLGGEAYGAGSENVQLTSLASSEPFIQAAGKKVRAVGCETLSTALDSQAAVFFQSSNSLFVSRDDVDVTQRSGRSTTAVRAPPSAHRTMRPIG